MVKAIRKWHVTTKRLFHGFLFVNGPIAVKEEQLPFAGKWVVAVGHI